MSSGRPSKVLLVSIHEIILAGADYGHEVLGHAVVLVAWMGLGHENPTDDLQRRVCRLETRVWKRLGADIRACADRLIQCSEPRARYGRPTLSKARRDAILVRDGEKCRYCKTKAGPFHIDHVKPLARGGSNRDDNLCVACAPCNFAKAAKLGSEWNY